MSKPLQIPFNKAELTGKELDRVAEAFALGQTSGDGHFTALCSKWLETNLNANKALLTHSCTAALEIAALLCGIEEGDEIIMPSFTFVSTANAFVLRGAVPVFVDIEPETLNINPDLIEVAITERTKAIVVVHYAGAMCAMDRIQSIASRYGLFLIEDAAQAILTRDGSRFAGTIGDVGCISFHETKNIGCGEGGALLINNNSLSDRAEIIRAKGTNRKAFENGLVDKYGWVDIGSSYLPGEITAAFLLEQLENARALTAAREQKWMKYHRALTPISKLFSLFSIPQANSKIPHNSHIFFLLFQTNKAQCDFIGFMREYNIQCVFHYTPLHTSSEMRKFFRICGDMTVTEMAGERLVRLPLWSSITETEQDYVLQKILDFCEMANIE
jgi:dTDP-4-amino-4,6-dideoxygalactose transaminase